MFETISARWMDSLNAAQRDAVTAGDGPVLVIAGAGSGKTWTLACRVAHLIEQGVPPERILLLTFSRRAAREMLSRADRIVGHGKAHKVLGGTFHAVANRWLRLYGRPLGLPPDFTVLDQADSADLMDLVRGELHLGNGGGARERRFPKKDTLAAIYSRMVNAGQPLSGILETAYPWCTDDLDTIRTLFADFTRRKRAQNLLDYDDLLLFWRALAETPLGQQAARDIDHILVDEYQDTNPLQGQILLALRREKRNLMVVGDDAQCLPAGSVVQTERGDVPIECIRVGDRVLAGAGRGSLVAAEVTRVRRTRYVGQLLRITLASGRVLRATPNHMCFARMSDRPDIYYVSLMYRGDKGFRIGVTTGGRVSRRSAKSIYGLMVRTNQEQADRAWVLWTTPSREEAHYFEQLYSVGFGIPTTCFHAKGRSILFAQETIDRLFREVDTRTNAMHLMRALGLHFDHPHHFSSPVTERGASRRLLVHMGLFSGFQSGSTRRTASHRAWIQTTDPVAKERLQAAGIRMGRTLGRPWVAARQMRDMASAEQTAGELAEIVGADIARWACLSDNSKFAFHPASHIRPFMRVPISDGIQITADEVVEVAKVNYEGDVYDLDVNDLHNYVADGVVVHNSIYSFRSASVRNILDFPEQFPGTRRITLEQNYRSTRPILDASNAVIALARERFPKELWPVRSGGARPRLLTCADENEQTAQVCLNILEHREQGTELRRQVVLFRSGHHSDLLELELTRRNIPFVKYGGLKFLEAAHVKDVLAMLRVLEYPRDEVSWFRVLQLLDGIGPAVARSIIESLGVRRRVAVVQVEPAPAPAAAAELPLPPPPSPNGAALPDAAGLRNGAASPAGAISPDSAATSPTGTASPAAALVPGAADVPDVPDVSAAAASPVQRLIDRPPRVPEAAREPFEALRQTFADCLASELGPSAEVGRIRRFCEPLFERRYASAAQRIQDIEQLERVAGTYATRGRFLAELALDPPTSTSDLAGPPLLDEDYLILSTVHSAKGGEWDVVHVIHAADGMIPSDMATGDAESVEEERRLFYVALTRARDMLYVYFPLRFYRRPHGRDDAHHYAQLTRFLPESVQGLFECSSVGQLPTLQPTMSASRGAGQVDALLAGLWDG